MSPDPSALPTDAAPAAVLPAAAGGGAGLAASQRRALRRALDLRELRHGELWLSFFALGGTAGPDEVEDFVDGGDLGAVDRVLLARAANERLLERLAGLHVPGGGERPGPARGAGRGRR